MVLLLAAGRKLCMVLRASGLGLLKLFLTCFDLLVLAVIASFDLLGLAVTACFLTDQVSVANLFYFDVTMALQLI